MRIIVGITGASGSSLALDTVSALKDKGVEIELILTDAARKIADVEKINVDDITSCATRYYGEGEMTAAIASSTYPVDGMVILPCSLKTLSAVSHGFCNNLVTRSAENMLRMKKNLIICPRETPLSAQALENMRILAMQGAIIMPPIVAYYTHPRSIEDFNDFFAGKVLDALGIENDFPRWRGL